MSDELMTEAEHMKAIKKRLFDVLPVSGYLSGDDLQRHITANDTLHRHAREDLHFLLDEVWRLRKALGFYADREHWTTPLRGMRRPEAHDDRGRIARHALADSISDVDPESVRVKGDE